MKYNPSLGIFGNIKTLFSESNKTNNTVFNNENKAEQAKAETDDGLMDIASVASDEADASAELGEMVADLYDAVAELAELMAERE